MSQKSKDIAIVIPARLNSRRLKNKVLIKFNGLEMIEHVRRRAVLNSHKLPVLVLSNDKPILNLIDKYGGNSFKTTKIHTSGLSRVFEAASDLPYDKYLILQGDEILIQPSEIDKLIVNIKNLSFVATNCVSRIKNNMEISNPNIVKCTITMNKKISGIYRKSPLIGDYSKQIKLLRKINGMFAFNKQKITIIPSALNSSLIKNQSIEQLYFIENGIPLEYLEIDQDYPSVNTLSDYKKCLRILNTDSIQKKLLRKING